MYCLMNIKPQIWLCFKEEINSSTYLINNLKILTEKTRYDYNLTIMKSPKPANDNRFKK